MTRPPYPAGRFGRVRWSCSRPGCGAPHYARDLCGRHYRQERHRRLYVPKPLELVARPVRLSPSRRDLEDRGRLPAFYRKSTG